MVRSWRRVARANGHVQITDGQAYHVKVFILGFRGNSLRGKGMASEDKRKCLLLGISIDSPRREKLSTVPLLESGCNP